MPWRRFLLRALIRMGTLCCVLIAALFAASGWCALAVGHRNAILSDYHHVFASAGGLFIRHTNSDQGWGFRHPKFGRVLEWEGWYCGANTFRRWLPRFEFGRWPSFEMLTLSGGFPDGWSLKIPLWMPFIVVFLPTAYCWRWERRRRRGHCRRCDYDLTANTAGRCPECGTAFGVNLITPSPTGVGTPSHSAGTER